MKWFVCNAFGALCWVAGVFLAKATAVPERALAMVGGHQMLAAVGFGLIGALLLAWSNLDSQAEG